MNIDQQTKYPFVITQFKIDTVATFQVSYMIIQYFGKAGRTNSFNNLHLINLRIKILKFFH